jgi:hypothetical protein
MMPKISVVVCSYNMPREIPRTVRSLSPTMQQGVDAKGYEILIVDNGSTKPFDEQACRAWGGDIRVLRIPPGQASHSPVRALNLGIAEARGELIGVMIDGARLASPGLLKMAAMAGSLAERAVISTLGFHLGPQIQNISMLQGYDQNREDHLLAEQKWTEDGYRLFNIAAFAGSSRGGWFSTINESNAIFLRRELWRELDGFDERFQTPGGGYANLDLFSRAVSLPDACVITLLGEGTFHQFHGGVATNAIQSQHDIFRAEYETVRGHKFHTPRYQSIYLGSVPSNALASIADSARTRLLRESNTARPASKSQDDVERGSIAIRPPIDGAAAKAIPASEQPARAHVAQAKAHRSRGDTKAAASEYASALDLDPDLIEAYLGLAELRMPGPGYLRWLEQLHAALSPKTYLEIGIGRGASLALTRPPTRAVAVDPEPSISARLKAETHIFCETSDAFFRQERLAPLLGGAPLGLAFIDGLHHFHQSLKDFIHVESFCGPQSIVLFHDTIPFDERTQRPEREQKFYTGDVWKTVLCLKHYRPDLDIFTIATPWSGLTVVTGLDPSSRTLIDGFEEAVGRFAPLSFTAVEHSLRSELNTVQNNWELVRERLSSRGIKVAPNLGRLDEKRPG